MAIIDHIQCGRVIIFNSIIFRLRWAFCIDFNNDEQVIYRGIFGLKCVDKKTFLGFARIVDIFDYIDRDLTGEERGRIKLIYKTSNLMQSCDNMKSFIIKLYRLAKIEFFVDPDKKGWSLNEFKNQGGKT